MKIIDNRGKEEKEEEKVVPIRKGLDLAPPEQNNWLAQLTPGTVFLTRPNAAVRAKAQVNPALLEEYMLFAITDIGSADLHDGEGKRHMHWVVSSAFSAVMELVEILPPRGEDND